MGTMHNELRGELYSYGKKGRYLLSALVRIGYFYQPKYTASTIVESKSTLWSTHPGEILRLNYLLPLHMSVSDLARALHVPASRLAEIVKERRSVSADMSLRLVRYFGGDAQAWLNLQSSYDLHETAADVGERINREVRPRGMAIAR